MSGSVSSAASDRVFVRGLVLDLEIGVFAHEHGRRQRVRFTVEADVLRVADPADFYSYDLMIEAIQATRTRGHVELVETHAEEIAARVLQHPRIARVLVRVEKLDLGPESAGIEIQREREAISSA